MCWPFSQQAGLRAQRAKHPGRRPGSWLDSPWQANRLHLLAQPVFIESLSFLEKPLNRSFFPCDGLASPRGGCSDLSLHSSFGKRNFTSLKTRSTVCRIIVHRIDFFAPGHYRKETMKEPCSPKPESSDPDLRPVEGPDANEELAALAKALGHPARVQIVRILARRTTCVCGDIVDELPLSQSTVSQHLKVLKDVGIIRGEIDGPRVCYCLSPRTLRRLRSLISSL